MTGFDPTPATIAAIKGGWTDLVMDQQPWLQGYLPIVQICLSKTYRFSGLHIDTGAVSWTRATSSSATLAEKEIR